MPIGWDTKAGSVWALVPVPTWEMPRFSEMSRSIIASGGSCPRMCAISSSDRPS